MDHAKAIRDATRIADERASEATHARTKRDKVIARASRSGMSVREIAAAAGKSHGWAHGIIKRQGKS